MNELNSFQSELTSYCIQWYPRVCFLDKFEKYKNSKLQFWKKITRDIKGFILSSLFRLFIKYPSISISVRRAYSLISHHQKRPEFDSNKSEFMPSWIDKQKRTGKRAKAPKFIFSLVPNMAWIVPWPSRPLFDNFSAVNSRNHEQIFLEAARPLWKMRMIRPIGILITKNLQDRTTQVPEAAIRC